MLLGRAHSIPSRIEFHLEGDNQESDHGGSSSPALTDSFQLAQPSLRWRLVRNDDQTCSRVVESLYPASMDKRKLGGRRMISL